MHRRLNAAGLSSRAPSHAQVVTVAAVIVFVVVVLLPLTGGLAGQVADGRGYPAEDWPVVGGNLSSSRYSTLTDITTDTVDRLSGAWVTELAGASSRATPVVKDGILDLTAGANVFAIDGRTGETVWRWQADDPEARMVPSWQGVALGEELVFVGLLSAQVAALRQDTGELVWVASVGSVPQQAGDRHDGPDVCTRPDLCRACER